MKLKRMVWGRILTALACRLHQLHFLLRPINPTLLLRSVRFYTILARRLECKSLPHSDQQLLNKRSPTPMSTPSSRLHLSPYTHLVKRSEAHNPPKQTKIATHHAGVSNILDRGVFSTPLPSPFPTHALVIESSTR